MSTDKIWGVVRAVVAGAGGLLVGLGLADEGMVAAVADSVEVIVGAVGVIAAAVASVYSKIKA